MHAETAELIRHPGEGLQPSSAFITLLVLEVKDWGSGRVTTVAITKDRGLGRRLETLFDLGAIRELTDGQLLERFARGEGEAAGLAFAALVERHGAMVMRVCRTHAADPHDSQDAFQATFLVLVEKARGLWIRDSLGPWLHQVAVRTASSARRAALRRKRLERRAAELADRRDESGELDPDRIERARRLHGEIERLPERYRVPIVLCDLEGRTCEEAARVLGCPVGTIKCWRSRGRKRLRRRLIRAGLAPGIALEMALGADAARASAPDWKTAAEQTIRMVTDRMTAGEVPAQVAALAKGVLVSMFLSKLRTNATALGALTIAGAGLIAAARVASGDDKPTPGQAPAAAKQTAPEGQRSTPVVEPKDRTRREHWPLSLRDAIWVGLDNADWVKIIRVGQPGPNSIGMIAPISADADIQRFRSSAIATVRSIEQAYWNLAQAQVHLWATENAVKLGREILTGVEAAEKSGRASLADVTEAARRFEQLRLDASARFSDVNTAERKLRDVMGMGLADDRPIVPVSRPCLAKVDPDWDRCLAAMLRNQPDILLAKRMWDDEQRRLEARGPLDQVAGAFLPDVARRPERSTEPPRQAIDDPVMIRRLDLGYKESVRNATHSLARACLNVDSTYKQAQIATRQRAAAAKRLELERRPVRAGQAQYRPSA